MVQIGRLHVLTDYHFQQERTPSEQAALAIAGGADVIQFRQKRGSIRDKLALAAATAKVCAHQQTAFIVDDHVDLTLAVGADGVHLGQNDLPVKTARMILGEGAIIGATATTLVEAERAWRDGASYIGFGPVFPTRSKANPASVKGLEGLAAVCEAVPLPVIAIAGISAHRVAGVMQAGAHGVAVMTAISLAEDPISATRAIREALDRSQASA